ncbi:MAG TPA: lysylphosphatidylglycerol synthase transmembrane domain-containing protein [Planctomycetota bacterium]|jgi:hypothetical protein|nr:lysylphosphatidylglycerol synthase transmembrane domain-containing protein [Planctomycetota bacterium]
MVRKRALGILRVAFAAALIAWIGSRVSLSDAAVRRDPGGEVLEARSGRAVGPWNAERVPFRDGTGRVEALERAEGWRVAPGLRTLVANLDLRLYGVTLLVCFTTPLLTVVRWRALLRAVGIRVGFGEACRLTYVGLFFNLVVPGLTGGDVVKAVLAARSTDRREAAVVSVLVDRGIGTIALALLAAVVVWPRRERFSEIATGIYLLLGALAVASLLLLSRRLRRWLAVDRLVRALPFAGVVRRVDEAVLAYRDHPRTLANALALSLANHLAILAGVVFLARGLGDPLPVGDYLVLVPTISILSAAPIAPGGWGVGETLFGEFFRRYGSSLELGVAISVLYRLAWMVASLPGGAFWMTGRRRSAQASLGRVPTPR